VYCTPGRSRKVVVALAVVALTVGAIMVVFVRLYHERIFKTLYIANTVVLCVMLPVTVLVINVTVVCAVRRASNNAAANLGQQSTSSSSAVPTVMLVTTSLIYVLLYGTWAVFYILFQYEMAPQFVYLISFSLQKLVYAYNFYVYLITGKQFRLELRQLFHCCTPPHHAAAAAERADDLRQLPRDQADTRV